MSSLIPFVFESKSIRVLNVDGLPWFTAKDVMQALDYSENSLNTIVQKIAHIPEEWKALHPMLTPGGVQEAWCLSEPGLYFFVNRSDKPKALPFQKWVAGEVLPAIRQTGGYGVQPMHTPQPETVTLARDEYLALKEEMLGLYREVRDLHKVKIEYLESQPRRRVLEEEEKAEIRRLHALGWSAPAIGRQVGRPTGSIDSYLRRVRLGQEE